MRHVALTILILLVLGGCAVLVGVHLGPAPAHAAPVSAPSASAESTSTPAPRAVVRAALRQRSRAVAAWLRWNRARECLGIRLVQFNESSARRPLRSEPAARWVVAGLEWKRDAVAYRWRTGKLVSRMRHPGGSSNGARWIPLAKWVGWAKGALHNLAWLMMNESSGRERAISATDDWGLCQFNRPSWAGTFRRIIGVPFEKGALIAEYNLRFALYVYHLQHNSWHPAWNGDPAAQW